MKSEDVKKDLKSILKYSDFSDKYFVEIFSRFLVKNKIFFDRDKNFVVFYEEGYEGAFKWVFKEIMEKWFLKYKNYNGLGNFWQEVSREILILEDLV